MGFSKIPFSTGSSRPKDWTQVSCIAGRFLTVWTTRGAPLFLHVVPKGRFPAGLSPRPTLVTLQIPSRQSSQQHDFTTNSQGDDSQVSVSSTGFAPVFYDLNMYLFWLGESTPRRLEEQTKNWNTAYLEQQSGHLGRRDSQPCKTLKEGLEPDTLGTGGAWVF